MSASMIPVTTCRINSVSAALPKTYHQLADLRGTGWAIVSRMKPPSCNLRSNQSAILSNLDIRSSSHPGRQLSGFDQQLPAFHLVGILEQAARRRAGGARAILVVHAAMARTHEQSGLREPAHRASQVGAVDSENLKLLALNAADPTRNAVGLSVGNTRNGIFKLGQPGLAFRELIELTQRDPAFVLPAIAAEDRRNQIADDWHCENGDRQAIQQHSNPGKQVSPGDFVFVLIAHCVPPVKDAFAEAAWLACLGRCATSHATTSEISWSVMGCPGLFSRQSGALKSGRPVMTMVRSP